MIERELDEFRFGSMIILIRSGTSKVGAGYEVGQSSAPVSGGVDSIAATHKTKDDRESYIHISALLKKGILSCDTPWACQWVTVRVFCHLPLPWQEGGESLANLKSLSKCIRYRCFP